VIGLARCAALTLASINAAVRVLASQLDEPAITAISPRNLRWRGKAFECRRSSPTAIRRCAKRAVVDAVMVKTSPIIALAELSVIA
jgi:hypothetical protein